MVYEVTMNLRIRQLAEQANLSAALLLHYYGTVDALTDSEQKELDQIEKFAQLIIDNATECVRDILRDENSDLTYAACDQVQQRIRQHFEVEERAIPILSTDQQALFSGIALSESFTIEGAKKAFGVE